jgi:lipopolysaccharide transport system permease protein
MRPNEHAQGLESSAHRAGPTLDNPSDGGVRSVADGPSLPEIVYTPASALGNPGQLLRAMVSDLTRSRELAWRLAVRDISAQYRQSFLGLLWLFILPLLNTLVWVFIHAIGVVKISTTDIPYPVYVFTGSVLWSILVDAINAPLQQTTASKAMLSKLRFPPEALIVSGLYQTAFNAVIKVVILLAVLPFFGIALGQHLLLFPFALTSLLLLGTAFGLLLTPVGLLYNDVQKGLALLLQFLMYLTPVVFAMPKDGVAAIVYGLNPFTPPILTGRAWLTGLPADHWMAFVAVNLLALLILVAMWVVYRLAMPILIERMHA